LHTAAIALKTLASLSAVHDLNSYCPLRLHSQSCGRFKTASRSQFGTLRGSLFLTCRMNDPEINNFYSSNQGGLCERDRKL